MKGERVLVTGATGFIGRHVVARLVRDGAAAIGAAVRSASVPLPAGVTAVPCDLRVRSELAAVTAFEPSVVIHLAAFSQVGASHRQPDDCIDLNVKGTALLLDAVPTARAIVFASSLEVYGPSAPVPFVESLVPAPASPYAISKYAAELLCLARASERVRVRVLRLANVYGDGQAPPAIVPELIASCLAGRPVRTSPGAQTRDFLYVDDAVNALIAAATSPAAIDGAINVGSGRELAIRDLVQRVAALTATTSAIEIGALPYRPNEIMRSFGDPSKARATLGWSPSTSLDEGLARTIAAARARAA